MKINGYQNMSVSFFANQMAQNTKQPGKKLQETGNPLGLPQSPVISKIEAWVFQRL